MDGTTDVFIEARTRDGRLLDQWRVAVPTDEQRAFLNRLRDAVFAAREALRTTARPGAELDAERMRIAAMAERSREGRATRKGLAQRADDAWARAEETAALEKRRAEARRAAEEERLAAGRR